MTTEKPHQSSFSVRLTPGPPRHQIVFSSPLAVNSSALPGGTGLEMETQGFFPPRPVGIELSEAASILRHLLFGSRNAAFGHGNYRYFNAFFALFSSPHQAGMDGKGWGWRKIGGK